MSPPLSPAPVLLAVDIGNSTADFGLFHGRRLLRRRKHALQDRLDRRALSAMLRGRPRPEAVAVLSVNPAATRRIEPVLRRIARVRPLHVGRDLPIDLPLRTRSPNVGLDRLCAARAAYEMAQGACIIVTCGTAITVNAVSRRGEFLGGAITAGTGLTALALHEQTALLPAIQLRTTRRAIGRDTVEAMRSGILLGAAGAIEHLVRCVKNEMGGRPVVFITGGDAKTLGRLARCCDKIVPELALRGVQQLYDRHRARSAQADDRR